MKESFLHYIWQFRKFEGATSSQILLSDENKKKLQLNYDLMQLHDVNISGNAKLKIKDIRPGKKHIYPK